MDKRFSRRTLLRRGFQGAAGIAAMSYLGSLGGVDMLLGEASAAESVKRGGVLRLTTMRTLTHFDRHINGHQYSAVRGVYEYLFKLMVDPETQETYMAPELATDWHWEDDGKRLVVELRQGIRFHDNSAFDAEVAKWNFDRIINHPESGSGPLLRPFVTDVDILDNYAIAFNLNRPWPFLPHILSSGIALGTGMVSREFHDKHGEQELARRGCGTGPFRYKEWIVDNRVVVERNNDYWRNGVDGQPLPYLDGIEEYYTPNINLAVVNLRAGVYDGVREPDARDWATVEAHPDLTIQLIPPNERHWMTIGLNSRQGPFTSHSLRKAALYAIDRERFAAIMGYGFAAPHQYPSMRPGIEGWAPDRWPDYSFDLQKARELVRADYSNGVDVKFSVIAREPDLTLAQVLQSMWNEAGIRTEITSLERLTWIDSMRQDEFHACSWAYAVEPAPTVASNMVTGAGGNWSNFSHPKVDELIAAHRQEMDANKRHDLIAEAWRIVFESAELTCAYALTQAYAMNKRVKNFRNAWTDFDSNEAWLDS